MSRPTSVTTNTRHEKKRGRPPLGDRPLTAAERQRRRRQRIKDAEAQARNEVPGFDLRRELLAFIDRAEFFRRGCTDACDEQGHTLLALLLDYGARYVDMRAYRRSTRDPRCSRDDPDARYACSCETCERERFVFGEWPYGLFEQEGRA